MLNVAARRGAVHKYLITYLLAYVYICIEKHR